jgi:hypothetical protein
MKPKASRQDRKQRNRKHLRDESIMTVEKVQYTAKMHTRGGRDGASHSDDGRAKN